MGNSHHNIMELLGQMEKEFENQNYEYFARLVHHKNMVIRIRAVCILATIGSQNAVKELVEVLERDDDALVRHEAAFSLGQLGFTSAIKSLSQAVQTDQSSFVRHEAAIALGVIGSENSRSVLVQALHDISKEVRDSAVIALSNIDYISTTNKNNKFNKMTGG